MLKRILFVIFIFSTCSSFGQWYGFGKEIQLNWSSDINLSNTKLFPDSTVYVTSSSNGELIPVFNHSTGQVFDPTSEFFELHPGEPIPYSEPYLVDSVGYWYTYQRAQVQPDTLIIQFFKEENLELIVQPWPSWDGMESASRARMSYDLEFLRSPDPFLEVIEILDDEDITFPPISKFMTIPIEQFISAGEVVAATVTYYPGNPYNSGDTLEFDLDPIDQLNQFTMRHYSDYDQIFETNDYNHGFMAHTCVRYGSCGDWEEQYISGNAWGGEGGRIFHSDIRFHVSQDVGLDDHLLNERLIAFPNPAVDIITLDANFDFGYIVETFIYDINGRLIVSKVIGSNNTEELKLDVSSLQNGIYVLRTLQENRIFTTKFVKQ